MKAPALHPLALICAIVVSLLMAIAPTRTQAVESAPESELWQAIANGSHVAIIRHALAPGIGDPAEFDLDDCATQRNLDNVGREQARRIGQRFRDNGIAAAEVRTSQWCRCRDTAFLLELGAVSDLPALNSFFQDYALQEQRTRGVLQWLKNRDPGQPLVLVTHQVNIRALTGAGASSGEIVVFRLTDGDSVEVLGRIATPTG